MQFIDLREGCQRHEQTIDGSIARVLERGQFVQVNEFASLECKLASFVGVEYSCIKTEDTDFVCQQLLALQVVVEDVVGKE